MLRTYFSTFQLGRKGQIPDLEEAVGLCKHWVYYPRGKLLLDAIPFDGSDVLRVGPGYRINIVRHCNESHKMFGLVFEHRDSKDDKGVWKSEITLVENCISNRIQFSMSVYYGYTGDRFVAKSPSPSCPKLVKMLIGKFGGNVDIPITSKPVYVDARDANTLISLLLDKKRILPVVVCSMINENSEYYVDYEYLASILSGMAHVFVELDTSVSFSISDKIGKSFSCYNGAVRIYWPGFSTNDDPYDHPLWITEAHSKDEVRDDIVSRVYRLACNRMPRSVISFYDIEKLTVRERINKLHEQASYREIFEILEDDNVKLKKKNDQLRTDIDQLYAILEEEEKKADKQRELVGVWKAKFEELKQQVVSAPLQQVGGNKPQNVDEVIKCIKRDFDGKIKFPLNSKSEVKDNPFGDPEGLYIALKFLATTYRDAKMGNATCHDFNELLRDVCSFGYKPNQSEATMSRYKNYYRISWNGEKRWLEEHLTKGNSTDPKSTIRVAFFFDEASSLVVVGYIGQHQRSKQTN